MFTDSAENKKQASLICPGDILMISVREKHRFESSLFTGLSLKSCKKIKAESLLSTKIPKGLSEPGISVRASGNFFWRKRNSRRDVVFIQLLSFG